MSRNCAGCLLLFLAFVLSGCSFLRPVTETTEPPPTAPTIGEAESGYAYIPIDPLPVRDAVCPNEADLLESLPDNAVRMLIERVDTEGAVTYGASKATVRGESYRVTVDYINADTINLKVLIYKFMRKRGSSAAPLLSLPELEKLQIDERFHFGRTDIEAIIKRLSTPADGEELVDMYVVPDRTKYELGSERYAIFRVPDDPLSVVPPEGWDYGHLYNLPVYVGVGLRVSANVYVAADGANISGISLIGAEAEHDRVKGSLVVQTLGVNGKSVASALPIQSELNRTTAENAILAVASIKALLYEDTVKSAAQARVVGIYLPFPGGKPLVNAVISALSSANVEWVRRCKGKPTAR